MKIDYKKFIEKNFQVLNKDTGSPVPFKFTWTDSEGDTHAVQEKYYELLTDQYGKEMEGVREIVLKARQEGMSTFILALFTVDFLLKPYSTSICISHRKDATDILFKKVKFFIKCYLENLAEQLKIPYEVLEKRWLTSDNKSLLENAENHASFYIGTAGAKVGGRGGTVNNILFSECAFYQDTELITAQEIVLGTSQQVTQGKGKIFIESTANGEGNYYHAEWERASLPPDREGNRQSSYYPRFFGWQEFYTEEWITEKMREFPNEKMGKQEYPRDPDEAFVTSGTPYFDPMMLNAMYQAAPEPIRQGKFDPDGGLTELPTDAPVRIYREPAIGEQFVIFADPADSQDFCAAVAASKKHYDFPIVMNEVMDSSQFGYELFYLAKYIYHRTDMWPKLAVERNTGQATIYVLKQLNYPDLFRMVDFSSRGGTYEKGGIGWVTTGHISGGELQGTRRKMLDDLALSLKQGVLTISDKQQIRQMKSFQIVKGRAQARSNKHDDLVMACYSDDTEVLTEDGWKLIGSVESGEKIPSLNIETNEVELATNKETINSPYRGKMIHFKSRSIDFLVTPNHKMLIHKSKGANKYSDAEIVRADSLLGKHFRLHKDAQWHGEKPETWVIPGYKPSKYHKKVDDFIFDIDDLMKMLGFYIAEGSAYGNKKDGWKLIFSQKKKSKGFKPFKQLLEKVGLKYKYDGSDFVLHNTHLAKYFKQLVPGKCYEKRIPGEILELHPEILKHLFEFMMLGDGSSNRHYVTSSPGLSDDFTYLVNKLGWSTTMRAKDNIGRKIFGDRAVRHKEYYISIIKEQLRPRLNHHHKNHVSEVNYEGNQVCLSLSKNHIMLVRRNNTTMWSGNTAGAWQVHQLTPAIDFGDYDPEEFRKEKEKWRFK